MSQSRTAPVGREETFVQGQYVLSCFRPAESRAVLEDLEDYFRHGITVRPGDTVFDVGANIGQFSLLAHERGQRQVNVYAFEPIPAIAALLHDNLWRADPVRLKAFGHGLGRESGQREFAYHRNASLLSNASPQDVGVEAAKLKETILRNCVARDAHPRIRPLGWMPAFLRRFLLERTMRAYFDFERVTCPVLSLSQVLRTSDVTRIDLLKINVERMEQEVLDGISGEDWPRISQVVMEVHDLGGRLSAVTGLLRARGFESLVVEQTPIFRGSDVHMVYARRSAA